MTEHFLMPFRKALRDPNVLGSVFGNLDTRRNWEVIGAALFAEPPELGDLEIFQKLTGQRFSVVHRRSIRTWICVTEAA